jgi:hypothetical protein
MEPDLGKTQECRAGTMFSDLHSHDGVGRKALGNRSRNRQWNGTTTDSVCQTEHNFSLEWSLHVAG